jgi:serine/threonine protein kinase
MNSYINNDENKTAHSAIADTSIHLSNTEEYSDFLTFYKLDFKAVDYYLHVGVTDKIQGWVLHVSVVISQVADLLHMVLPYLAKEKISFKIISDKETARNILDGNMGLDKLGKIVSIYPENDTDALELAKELIVMTTSLKGPVIPTDINLGNIVHTRYGSINPLILTDSAGKRSKYIYNNIGQLIEDNYSIPFKLPDGIQWPFKSLSRPIIPAPRKILNGTYKLTTILKADIRGNVYKGLYLKSLFSVKPCVIKEGKKFMVSEDSGRNIYDRLEWQNELHGKLKGHVPLPQIYDFFQIDEDSYLVMEYIYGVSFYDRLKQINFNSRSWISLHKEERLELLDYLIKILSAIGLLHKMGYVHRDISPGNFLINAEGQITLIDIELAYPINKKILTVPFEHGTPGFISPAQQNMQVPTIKDDIYGLGALMMTMFTGLSPMKFNTEDTDNIIGSIKFFTGNHNIASLISSCVSPDPEIRPDLETIQLMIREYTTIVKKTDYSIIPQTHYTKLPVTDLNNLISASIAGLTKPPMVMLNDMWYSRMSNTSNPGEHRQKEYTRYCGMYEGVGGILYVLSNAKITGYSVDSAHTSFIEAWSYIKNEYLDNLPNIPSGLYGGSAGIAVMIAKCIRSGLLEKNSYNIGKIEECLCLPNTDLDLANGITGQGIAILNCIDFLDDSLINQLLEPTLSTILRNQLKNGAWKTFDDLEHVGLNHGVSGIAWFLLEYTRIYENIEVENAVVKALQYLLKRTNHLKDLFNGVSFKKIVHGNEAGDERKGIILTFIKAYEILQDSYYKEIAENALATYLPETVKNNYTQSIGLSSLGELYLEAFRVTDNNEWQKRADWITHVFAQTFYRNNDNNSGHWLVDENKDVIADFLVGNSGIIQYLLRYQHPDRLGYRLLI